MTCLLPGLSGTPARLREAGIVLPRLPALERIHARAVRSPAPAADPADLDGQLCAHAGLPDDGPGRPYAALRYLGLTGRHPAGTVIAADPVLLRAEQDRLLMLHADCLAIGDDEARALVAHLNDFYADDGWRFEAPAPDQWFLFIEGEAELHGQPHAVAVGHNINDRLPGGTIDGRACGVVANEIQMLLHDAPVNRAREADGRPPVNGIWLWGAGRLPAGTMPGISPVYAEHPLARGLAVLGGNPCRPVDEWHPAAGGSLLFHDGLHRQVLSGDLHAQHQALLAIEREIVGPVLTALRSGKVDELVLDDGGHQWLLDRARLRRFWRRPREIER